MDRFIENGYIHGLPEIGEGENICTCPLCVPEKYNLPPINDLHYEHTDHAPYITSIYTGNSFNNGHYPETCEKCGQYIK